MYKTCKGHLIYARSTLLEFDLQLSSDSKSSNHYVSPSKFQIDDRHSEHTLNLVQIGKDIRDNSTQ
jgi:hypothetical protein